MLDDFNDALVRSPDREELLRALSNSIAGLQRESDEVQDLAAMVEPQLRELTAAWN